MQNLATFFEVVAAEWRRRGVPLLPPASETEIAGLFADLGCPVSSDVRALYATVGGFADCESDGLWSLWSPKRIREEAAGERRPFVIFADWLISSHVYCLRFEGPEVSSVYMSHDGWSLEPEPVACGVAEFFEKLLCNPAEVWAWPLDD